MKNILVFAAGGGGDVATAAAYALKLRRQCMKTYVAAAPWERMSIDPYPGPIKFGEIRNIKYSGDGFLIVDENSYSMRNGKKVVFQAANVSKAISEDVYLCDMNKGVYGLYKCFEALSEHLGLDAIIALDVGGDILALGCERDLWSPLADQLSLASLYKTSSTQDIYTEVAIASPGADGELNREYVYSMLNKVVSEGGLKGTVGFGYDDIDIIENILNYTVTEAGRIILDALKGISGYKFIRDGTRRVYIDILSTLVFNLDTYALYRRSVLSKRIFNSRNIEDANKILLDMGVATEYELEKEIYKYMEMGFKYDGDLVIRARESIFRRIGECKVS